MDLNSLQLPPSLLQELFSDSLVAAPVPMAPKPAPGPAGGGQQLSYRYLGSNHKNIVVILRSKDAAIISDQHLTFLSKMLEACKKDLRDVAIVNDLAVPVQADLLCQQLRPSIVLLFGLEPTQIKLPFNIPTFKAQAFDGCTYLYCPDLEALNQDTEEGKLLKSKLWLCLKPLFGV